MRSRSGTPQPGVGQSGWIERRGHGVDTEHQGNRGRGSKNCRNNSPTRVCWLTKGPTNGARSSTPRLPALSRSTVTGKTWSNKLRRRGRCSTNPIPRSPRWPQTKSIHCKQHRSGWRTKFASCCFLSTRRMKREQCLRFAPAPAATRPRCSLTRSIGCTASTPKRSRGGSK